MNEKKKGFFGEFKAFIARGNIMDMAVGVIIGGAFTAIVTALTNGILKPIINWILALIVGGNDPLAAAYTFLKKAYVLDDAGKVALDESGAKIIDLTKSIYIDWGSFVSAIINFLLIAMILFIIVKAFNKVREKQEAFKEEQLARIEARKAQIIAEENAKLEASKENTPKEITNTEE